MSCTLKRGVFVGALAVSKLMTALGLADDIGSSILEMTACLVPLSNICSFGWTVGRTHENMAQFQQQLQTK